MISKASKTWSRGIWAWNFRGAGDRLKDIEYIAIDGGYERGISEEETFTTLTNFLIKKNFQILDIYFPWYRGLFKNSNF